MCTKFPCGQTCQYGFQRDETKQNCVEKTKQNCVEKDEFLRQVDCLNEQQKNWKSAITMFIDDGLYEQAKKFLLANENHLQDEVQKTLFKCEIQTITRKQWTINANQQIITKDNKIVLCKSQLHKNL